MQDTQSSFGLALARFFQEEALMLRDLVPHATQDYVRALWFEGKRYNWPCANGAMEDLFMQFLEGKIVPTRNPQLGAVKTAIKVTRSVLQGALGPASAAVVSDRALQAAVAAFPAAREPMLSVLQ